MVDDPMNEILKNIDKQMEEKGIIAKNHVPINFANPGSDSSPASQNFNAKNSRVENLENTFQSTTTSPGKIPYYKKKKIKKLNDLDKYVIFAFTMLILYTIVDKITFLLTGGMESSTLTVSFFGVFGGEILLCAMIKRLKLHKEIKEKNDVGSNSSF